VRVLAFNLLDRTLLSSKMSVGDNLVLRRLFSVCETSDGRRDAQMSGVQMPGITTRRNWPGVCWCVYLEDVEKERLEKSELWNGLTASLHYAEMKPPMPYPPAAIWDGGRSAPLSGYAGSFLDWALVIYLLSSCLAAEAASLRTCRQLIFKRALDNGLAIILGSTRSKLILTGVSRRQDVEWMFGQDHLGGGDLAAGPAIRRTDRARDG
jgi:hypothetical protein